MKRYSIMAAPFGWGKEIELCQCDSNPQAIVEAAREKRIRVHGGDRYRMVAKYESLRIVDRGEPGE